LQRAAEGKPINSRVVHFQDSALANAATDRFDNLENALKAAGIDPDRVRKFLKWTNARDGYERLN